MAHAQGIATQLGIAHLQQKIFGGLSTGEQRRFLLGRALVHDPHTLLLDEPTASLDLQASFRLLGQLRELARRGKTLVLVTHHLREVPPEVSHVVLLKRGRVFAAGPKADVLTEANLEALFEVPLRLLNSDGYDQAFPR